MSVNFLSKYLDVRFRGELAEPAAEHKGMVVTISRDTGCDGMPIVIEIIKQLNVKLKGISKKHPWNYVSKELFIESARKLNVHPDIFDKLVHRKDKGFVEEIINSFSNENYPSGFKIKNTLKEVIKSVEKEGGVIILGRAGVAIVAHTKRNLHVKLTASLDWRVQKMAREHQYNEAKTRKHILVSDQKREELKKYYMRRKVHQTDYDVIFNVSSMSKNEICAALVTIIEEKRNLLS